MDEMDVITNSALLHLIEDIFYMSMNDEPLHVFRCWNDRLWCELNNIDYCYAFDDKNVVFKFKTRKDAKKLLNRPTGEDLPKAIQTILKKSPKIAF